MNLRIRYDDRYQMVTLDTEAVRQLWVSLGLTDEGYTQEEREQLMQEKFEEVYNRPEYNSWHKHWRHHGELKIQHDDEGKEIEFSEPLMSEVADDRIFRKDDIEREKKEDDEAICQWIRKVLCKEPEIAEVFIATQLGDMTIRDYVVASAKNGEEITKLENSLLEKLTRAAKILAEAYPDRDF